MHGELLSFIKQCLKNQQQRIYDQFIFSDRGGRYLLQKECNIEKVQEREVLPEFQRISTKFDLSVTLPA